MKVVINKCYGGFHLSQEALIKLKEMGSPYVKDYAGENTGLYYECWKDLSKSRTDPMLVQVIEEMKGDASTIVSDLHVVEIPDYVDFIIEEYDGKEWISEVHRTWE